MKRVAPILCVIWLFAAVNALLTRPAHADCSAEIQTVRAQVTTVRDDHRRQEVQKLVEKAEKDDKAGRTALCDQAVQQARALLK